MAGEAGDEAETDNEAGSVCAVGSPAAVRERATAPHRRQTARQNTAPVKRGRKRIMWLFMPFFILSHGTPV